MKVQLLHPDHDVALRRGERGRTILAAKPPSNAAELVQDLQLDPLFAAMSAGEELPDRVARTLVLSGLSDPDVVVFRQQVLRDCLEHPRLVADLYRLAGDAIDEQKKVYRSVLRERSESRLNSAAHLLDLLLARLRALRQLCAQATSDDTAAEFASPGLVRFFEQVRDELDDAYLDEVAAQVEGLSFRGGLLASGELGEGNQGSGYLLRTPDPRRRGFFRRAPLDGKTYSFSLEPRDDASANALTDLRDMVLRSLSRAANEAVDHVLAFFETLQHELAFYLGCIRLHSALDERGCPTTMPVAGARCSTPYSAEGLVDPCLMLHWGADAVGNGLDAHGKHLVVITGANGGGKSTLLRAVGIATLMARCGMFAAADAFSAPLFGNVFTHFRREEDQTMAKGKFDEELSRMSRIAEQITGGDLLLCNESFSATNEREGSQIAMEVFSAMADCGVRVVIVTHMFDLADTIRDKRGDKALFLQAERGANGLRTFRIRPGFPEESSHAVDLFDRLVLP